MFKGDLFLVIEYIKLSSQAGQLIVFIFVLVFTQCQS